jgi:hypothetical protein
VYDGLVVLHSGLSLYIQEYKDLEGKSHPYTYGSV